MTSSKKLVSVLVPLDDEEDDIGYGIGDLKKIPDRDTIIVEKDEVAINLSNPNCVKYGFIITSKGGITRGMICDVIFEQYLKMYGEDLIGEDLYGLRSRGLADFVVYVDYDCENNLVHAGLDT